MPGPPAMARRLRHPDRPDRLRHRFGRPGPRPAAACRQPPPACDACPPSHPSVRPPPHTTGGPPLGRQVRRAVEVRRQADAGQEPQADRHVDATRDVEAALQRMRQRAGPGRRGLRCLPAGCELEQRMRVADGRVGDDDLPEQADQERRRADRGLTRLAAAAHQQAEPGQHLPVMDDRAGDQVREGDEQAVVEEVGLDCGAVVGVAPMGDLLEREERDRQRQGDLGHHPAGRRDLVDRLHQGTGLSAAAGQQQVRRHASHQQPGRRAPPETAAKHVAEGQAREEQRHGGRIPPAVEHRGAPVSQSTDARRPLACQRLKHRHHKRQTLQKKQPRFEQQCRPCRRNAYRSMPSVFTSDRTVEILDRGSIRTPRWHFTTLRHTIVCYDRKVVAMQHPVPITQPGSSDPRPGPAGPSTTSRLPGAPP